MKIRLLCDDLMTRVRLESRFVAAGATLIKAQDDSTPDLIVLDLTKPQADSLIKDLRQRHPDSHILAFGPHVEGAAFKAARQSGADELVARGKVVERVLAKLQAD